jgi:MocE subfamily Rieske [2Fe-2S] domain protein
MKTLAPDVPPVAQTPSDNDRVSAAPASPRLDERPFYTVDEPSDLIRDYCLVGQNTTVAIQRGLAEAQWYQCPVPKETMRQLLLRRDWPAVRDTLLWFALLIGFGGLGLMLWGTWWAIIPFAIYGVLYGSTSDSRWHEASHGTAFKTDWLNNALYEIASFMVMRNSTLWRWSHTRHHSDTIIVGRDPEIAVPRPANTARMLLSMVGVPSTIAYFKSLPRHVLGRLTAEQQSFIPKDQWSRIYWVARVHALIYLATFAAAAYFQTILPLLFIFGPNFYGCWLMRIYGWTQHAGLAENVLDHRLNSRTVYMNFVNRYLYWNMNYHVEHHMFPLVPYHQLPRLHALVKHDLPQTYPSIWAAYREIIPAVIRQSKDPGYYIKRRLPVPQATSSAQASAGLVKTFNSQGKAVADGWIDVCAADELRVEDVLRFDHGQLTFAIYRTADGGLYATDGMCTHGRVHLAQGLVKGNLIECAKHNGRFDVRDGSVQRPPVCVGLRTYPVKEAAGRLLLNPQSASGAGAAAALANQTHTFRVVSNHNVATFIKELVLAPIHGDAFRYTPGDYLQLNIPAYDKVRFSDFDVSEPYRATWQAHHVFDYESSNAEPTRRNYSLAGNPQQDAELKFNVRIATPPRGLDCRAGVGSSYVWSLKPGDTVTAIGPFGDFHIKDTLSEMIYIGGGAGMAPLRAHLAHLLENLQTSRKISFWYGARSVQELFYTDYFENLAQRFRNFTFHVALSEPLPQDQWQGPTGFIHNVLNQHYLSGHPNPAAAEYYLCGPPAMVAAVRKMLDDHHVPLSAIACDEF